MKRFKELNKEKWILIPSLILFFITSLTIINILKLNNESTAQKSWEKSPLLSSIDTRINSSVIIDKEVDINLYSSKIFFFKYTIAETGEMISNCTIKYCEWYNKNNMSQIYNISLTETLGGLYRLNINTEKLDISKYVLAVSLGKENYILRTALINLNIIPINTRINGSVKIDKEVEVIVYSSKIFFFNYTIAETGEMISNCTIKHCEWYNKNNMSQIYSTSLTETLGGCYRLDINTEKLEISEYVLAVSLGKENFTRITTTIELNITDLRELEIIFSEEYDSNLIILNLDENIDIQVNIADSKNQSNLIIGALVFLKFNGENYYFLDLNNGSYSISVSSEIFPEAFFDDIDYVIEIHVQKSNYFPHVEEIIVKIRMLEIFGIPMFHFILYTLISIAIIIGVILYRFFYKD